MTWAVVLCRFRNVPQETKPVSFFRNYFTRTGAGTGGAFDYWNDISYGRFQNDSEIFGWFEIPHDSTEIAGGLHRSRYQQWGIDAARANNVPLDRFTQRIFFFNGNGDHGAVGGGTTVLSYAPGRPLEPTFFFHEMGHNLGLSHSFSDSPTGCCGSAMPGEYCDQWDIMSAMCVFKFQDTHGPTGPGMSVPYLDQLGWLDNSRVASMWNTGMGTTDIDLIPLNHPELEGFLAARINFIDRATRKQASYFVELRTTDRWDRGLPYSAVLIHRSESNRSILVGSGRPNRPNLEWQVGEVFHDHANMMSICVLSMDSDGRHAKVRVQLNGALEHLRSIAYLNWSGRGRPSKDDWTDWFHAEELRRQQLREAAYFHWINRGRPTRDDWADWFWAEKTGTP